MYYSTIDTVKSKHDKTKEVKRAYSVYLPIPKGKVNKSSIRGLWYSKDRLYYDYIIVKRYNRVDYKLLEYLKTTYKQEAIFYKAQGKAYIYYSISKVEVLKQGRYIKVNRHDKQGLKAIIRHYRGATIHKSRGGYIAEVWEV